MTAPISDLDQLLASMRPMLNPRPVAFVALTNDAPPAIPPEAVIGTFREREGLTVIADLDAVERLGSPVLFRASWITLTVHSDLQAVGLTAAFTQALGEAGVSCNVVAAAFHDHIFVPVDRATDAMAALGRLQEAARRRQANSAPPE